MKKDHTSVIEEIDKLLAKVNDKKTYKDYKSTVKEVDHLLKKLEEREN